MKLPKVIGHRGAALLAPENTLASIKAAAAAGATWVEIDVYPIAHGGLIIFHDDTLERCTNGQGATQDADMSLIRTLDAGSWFAPSFTGEPIPDLIEALDAIQALGLGLNLEIKYEGKDVETVVPPILEALNQHWQDKETLLLSSFNYPALEVCHRSQSGYHLGYLVEEVPEDCLEKLAAINAYSLNCDYLTLTERQAQQIKALGYKLLCYTANSMAAVANHWQWGMDAVITDDPQSFAELLN